MPREVASPARTSRSSTNSPTRASTRSSRSPRLGSSSSPSPTWRRGTRAAPGLMPNAAAGDEGGSGFDAGVRHLEAVNGNVLVYPRFITDPFMISLDTFSGGYLHTNTGGGGAVGEYGMGRAILLHLFQLVALLLVSCYLFKMVKLTVIACITDGLPLAGCLDDGRYLKDVVFYKQPAKLLFKNLSKGQHESSKLSIETGPYLFQVKRRPHWRHGRAHQAFADTTRWPLPHPHAVNTKIPILSALDDHFGGGATGSNNLFSASTYRRVIFLSGLFHTVMDAADLILEKLLYQIQTFRFRPSPSPSTSLLNRCSVVMEEVLMIFQPGRK